MYIRLNDPSLLGDLIASLLDARCIVEAVDDRTCRVTCPASLNHRQAAMELRFFVRAWLGRHGEADAILLV
jgi:hypothetical protein